MVVNLREEDFIIIIIIIIITIIIVVIHFEVFPDLPSSNLGPQAR